MPPAHTNHLDARKAAFKQIEKDGVIAFANRGQTQSAAWEIVDEALEKKRMPKLLQLHRFRSSRLGG